MFSQGDGGHQGFVLAVLSGLLALVASVVIVVAVYPVSAAESDLPVVHSARSVRPDAIALQEPTAALIKAHPASGAADVRVETGVLKFYFPSGNAELAPGAADVLAGLVASARCLASV
jgi:hypothetical protein